MSKTKWSLLDRIRNRVASWLVNDTSKVLLSLNYNGYLAEKGWINSSIQGAPVDKNGDPIPWVTYSFIDFFIGKKIRNFSILEFGSGNSTLFWNTFGADITSVEHDKSWFEKVRKQLPKDLSNNIHFFSLEGEPNYMGAAAYLNKKFDIIFVDGRERVACAKQSLPWLTEKGVLIWDDSERDRYKEGVDYCLEKGFKKLDFWGIAPGLFNNKSTSVFYRPGNVFDI